MKKKLKPILAVLAGLTVAFVLIVLSQMIGHYFYPIPDEFKNIDFSDPTNKAQLEALMATAPLGSLILILIGYMLAALGGGFVAALIHKKQKFQLSLMIGFFLTMAGISNLMMIPHPIWFIIINLPSYLLFAYLGSRLVTSKEY